MRRISARGRLCLRAGVVGLVAVVVAPLTSVVAQAAPVAWLGSAPAELVSEAAASAAAREFGEPVRVADLMSETSEVVANPDGSMTLTRHVEPVRVRRDGGWVPVDTTLVRRADGTLGPKAAVIDLSLSGARSEQHGDMLVTAAVGGKQVGLGWSGALPEPVLSGDVATYVDVLPGVDVKIQAEANTRNFRFG
ncbi:hypothetical protein [Actinokineospora sp.]|uniref:hypothetical protein n=1 Tax=Actinokineospora sp. TaxID=1872133 RepID=UPI003D6BDFC7